MTDKDFGPLVETQMTRCIHCTRCIRFVTEVAGVEELGATDRGEHMEISTYVEKALSSELSANIIDLCPVGALTSKPYAFVARPWELRKTESVDVFDAVGSASAWICAGREVLRMLPRLNDAVNEEWMSDKSRFAVDGLKRQRLDRRYVRRDGKLRPAPGTRRCARSRTQLNGSTGDRIARDRRRSRRCRIDVALKELMTALGSSNIDCRQDGAALDPRAAPAISSTPRSPASSRPTHPADRHQSALGSAGAQCADPQALSRGRLQVALIGPQIDLTYRYDYLGAGAGPWRRSPAAGCRSRAPEAAKKPMLILGQGALDAAGRPRGAGARARVAEKLNLVREDWNGFNVLHTAAARVGGMDVGFVPDAGGRDVAGILEGARRARSRSSTCSAPTRFDTALFGKAFVVYQGHHGDAGAHRADVVFPGAAYTEKTATYVNTEGRPQQASARSSRRARRGRIGRSSGHCRGARRAAALRHAGAVARAGSRRRTRFRRYRQ